MSLLLVLNAANYGQPAPTLTDVYNLLLLVKAKTDLIGTNGSIPSQQQSVNLKIDEIRNVMPGVIPGEAGGFALLDENNGDPRLLVGLLPNTVNASALATDAVTEIISALFAANVETGETFLQFCRLVQAVLLGTSDATDANAGTVVFRRADGSTVALTATYNAQGDRTTVAVGSV